MTPGKVNFTIYKGAPFRKSLRWESDTVAFKNITAVSNLAPLTLTVPGHSIPDGWRFAVQSVKGMTQLNAIKKPPAASEYYKAKVQTTDSIEIAGTNGYEFSTYTSGGVILYNTPQDLSGFDIIRLVVKDKVGGTELMSLSAAPYLVVDAVGYKINIDLPATYTELITWSKGQYELELEDSTSGEVVKMITGTIKVVEEIATS